MLELDSAFDFHGEGCGILTCAAVLPVVACPGAVALVAIRPSGHADASVLAGVRAARVGCGGTRARVSISAIIPTLSGLHSANENALELNADQGGITATIHPPLGYQGAALKAQEFASCLLPAITPLRRRNHPSQASGDLAPTHSRKVASERGAGEAERQSARYSGARRGLTGAAGGQQRGQQGQGQQRHGGAGLAGLAPRGSSWQLQVPASAAHPLFMAVPSGAG